MGRRKKYDYAFRLECVETVLKKGRSGYSVAKEKGFEESMLRLWIGFYQRYGEAGLKPQLRRSYDASFKLEVLTAIDKEFLSLREACFRFNISSDALILSWRKAYKSKGISGLIPKPKGRPTNMNKPIKRKKEKSTKPLTREEELLIENEHLRAQIELLKKLHALVQTDKKQKP